MDRSNIVSLTVEPNMEYNPYMYSVKLVLRGDDAFKIWERIAYQIENQLTVHGQHATTKLFNRTFTVWDGETLLDGGWWSVSIEGTEFYIHFEDDYLRISINVPKTYEGLDKFDHTRTDLPSHFWIQPAQIIRNVLNG